MTQDVPVSASEPTSTATSQPPGISVPLKSECIYFRRNRANAIAPLKILPLSTKCVGAETSTAPSITEKTDTTAAVTTPGAPSREVKFEFPPTKVLTEEEEKELVEASVWAEEKE